MTRTSSGFTGTPAYASPEQGADTNDLDGRSDLYSLGIILWQRLAGHPPRSWQPPPHRVSDRGEIPPPGEPSGVVPISITLDSDGKTGMIHYGSHLGETSVRFNAARHCG